MSGIWRQVWIETTGQTYVSDIHIIPDIDAGVATVRVEVSSPTLEHEKKILLNLRTKAPDGGVLATQQEVVLSKNDQPFRVEIQQEFILVDQVLWTPDDPQLYSLTAELVDRNTVVDVASRNFGMRKISTAGIRIHLNNQPIFLMGAIDAGDVPDKNVYLPKYHAPTDDEIKHEVMVAKQMGFNIIRKHLIIDDHRYYDWADRLGLLVYGEPPYYWTIAKTARARWRNQVTGWVRRDRNHPSMTFWALFNAASGLEPMPLPFGGPAYQGERPTEQQQAAIVKAAREMVKRLDPTRPVIDTSGGKNFNTEIMTPMLYGFTGPHSYLRARSHYPGMRSSKPMICGEIGGYVFFPDMEKFKRLWGGQVPWPIVRPAGLGWGDRRFMGAGYDERFYRWGLDRVYGSFAEFADQQDWASFYDLKYETEQVRKSPDMSGCIYALFNNTGPFVHGLVDYDVSLRSFAQELSEFQNPDLLIIDWNRLNHWSNEEFTANILLSHYSNQNLQQCVAKWTLTGPKGSEAFDIHGEISDISMAEVGVATVGTIAFKMPDIDQSTQLRLSIELHRDDQMISRNYTDLYVDPKQLNFPVSKRKLNVNVFPAKSKTTHSIGDSTGPVKLTKVAVAVGDRINFLVDPINNGGGDTQSLHARITLPSNPKQVWDVARDWTTDHANNTDSSTWSKRWIEKPQDVTQRNGKYPLMTRNSFFDDDWNIGAVPPQFWNVGSNVGPFTWKNESDADIGITDPTGVTAPPNTVVWNPVGSGSQRYMAIHSWLSPVEAEVDIEFQATLLQASEDGVRYFIEKNNSKTTLADLVPDRNKTAKQKSLAISGYEQHLGIDPTIPVVVSTIWNDKIEDYLTQGGTVLLLVTANRQIPQGLGLTVGGIGYALAAKDHFWGYINPEHNVFRNILHENPLGWTFCNLLLSHQAIAGIDATNKQDILVGAYSEWLRTVIHSPERSVHGEITGLVVQFRYKQGRVVMTTLDLMKHLKTDPLATILLHDLIEYCYMDFKPTTVLTKK